MIEPVGSHALAWLVLLPPFLLTWKLIALDVGKSACLSALPHHGLWLCPFLVTASSLPVAGVAVVAFVPVYMGRILP